MQHAMAKVTPKLKFMDMRGGGYVVLKKKIDITPLARLLAYEDLAAEIDKLNREFGDCGFFWIHSDDYACGPVYLVVGA